MIAPGDSVELIPVLERAQDTGASANWKVDEALGVTREVFQGHPWIGVLFCANDLVDT